MITEFIHANPFIGIVLFSLTVSLFTTLVIFFFTDKEKMRELKERQKELHRKAKEHQKSGNQNALLEINKQMMMEMPEMMKHNFKPMLITFIPIIIIFTWANANIAYEPIPPQHEFVIVADLERGYVGEVNISVSEEIDVIGNKVKTIENNQVNWTLKGSEGIYFLTFIYNGDSASKNLIITEGVEYAKVSEKYKGKIKTITIKNKKLVYINLLGWKIGWLGSYIIFSLIFSLVFRKIFKMP